MSELEVAAGMPLGLAEDARLPEVTLGPMAALEDVVAEAVRRPPCFVAFSGGRDSSLILAATVRAAAREGCPKPTAITLRFPQHARANEDGWQDLVLEHLGVESHLVLPVGEELDLVGPTTTAELVRRGVLYPANVHSLAPLVAAASGGTLLVGLGGDELLGGHRWTRLNDALARRRPPRFRDATRLAVAASPAILRRRMLARRLETAPSWLRPTAARRVRHALRAEANEPVRFDRAVRWAARARTPLVIRQSLQTLARRGNVRIETPLLDPRFVAALARAGGARGWGDRVALMRAVGSGVLPDAVLDRRDKAQFDAVFFGAASRRFAETWSGQDGVDLDLVDPERLRREWLEPEPDFRSALLLQIAWLVGRDAPPLDDRHAAASHASPVSPGGRETPPPR